MQVLLSGTFWNCLFPPRVFQCEVGRVCSRGTRGGGPTVHWEAEVPTAVSVVTVTVSPIDTFTVEVLRTLSSFIDQHTYKIFLFPGDRQIMLRINSLLRKIRKS